MTNVFVWKNYGEVTVHAIETESQQEKLLKSVHECVRYVAADSDEVDLIDAVLVGTSSNISKIRRLLDITCIGNDNDSFEYGTGFYEVKE